MPKHDDFPAFYLARWRALTEEERVAMSQLRSVEFMVEARRDYYAEEVEDA